MWLGFRHHERTGGGVIKMEWMRKALCELFLLGVESKPGVGGCCQLLEGRLETADYLS